MLRRIFVTAALAAAVTIVTPSSPALALYPCPADYMCIHNWYTDSTRTHWNGSHSVNCEGTVARLGVQSGYLVFSKQPCDGLPV
ncbi:hypothetical protein GCM10027290_11930 [Micromonospora sonneratiae]|uniref:Peptidase inhibitor family I36 n=1 Tax=Micromonospora sonneratiae TaxID=1184706 RepID=A0ABW3YED7_9ACTN